MAARQHITPSSMGHGQHGMPMGDEKALKITGWLTGIYFLVELVIGYWSGSIAVLSDAFHTFSAVGGVLIALVASYFARRPASYRATFGYIRAEIIGALLNGAFLFLMAFYVFYMGYMRLKNPVDIATGPMLLAALGGLLTEAISLWLLIKRSKGNLNMQGALWHVLQTFVGSLLIIIAAVVIRTTGFYAIDPILGMVFGVVLLWASWGIIRQSTTILLQTVPDNLDLPALVETVQQQPGVKDVHHPHAWALTNGKNIVSMHVLVTPETDCQEVLEAIYQRITADFPVYFATIQVEKRCTDAPAASEIDALRTAGKEQAGHQVH